MTQINKGIDTDGYIFLDEAGSVQHYIELYVTWNWIHDKNYLVKVKKNLNIEYLKFDIISTMELQYKRLFSGLKNLTVTNLTKNGKVLPKVGVVSKVV